ncbi:MAG: ABC transporter ATP-binding protein [Anaerolineae bacterium]|nr:ABC transporter ATP-binding protein [Anaerolineae bacterium]
MITAIRAHNLTRYFANFLAVDHLTFEVAAGQVLGYLGPNGSGKTTTIRMLLGLLHPSEGEAQVLGYDVVSQSELVRSQTGYMSQKFALYNELTIWENLAFYAGMYGVRDTRQISAILESLGLGAIKMQKAQNLSAGWRQRLALATAIVHRPRLLFLDEPTSGVDPTARRSFWDLIYELSTQGITIMVTTHYMDEAEYCSVIGIMRAGKLQALDEPGHLKASIPGQVWEIYVEPLLPALEAVEGLPGIVHATLASDHLRVITRLKSVPERLSSELSSKKMQVQKILPGEATIEDVFIAMQ